MKKALLILACMALTAVGGTSKLAYEFGTTVDKGEFAREVGISIDFTGDGLLDKIFTDHDAWTFHLVENRGDGSFAPVKSVEVTWEPKVATAGDMNGDGRVDIAFVGKRIGGILAVGVLLDDGAGGFTAQYLEGGAGFILGPQDLDGDGDLDLPVIAQDRSAVTVLLNDGAGHLAAGEPIWVLEPAPERDPPDYPVFGDLDGDGLAEIAMRGDRSLSIRPGLAPGRFGEPTTVLPFRPDNFLVEDFDGDDRLDLLAECVLEGFEPEKPEPGLYLRRGIGDGTLAPAERQSAANTHTREPRRFLAASDLDGDGDLDLISNRGVFGLTLVTNSGDADFSTSTELALSVDGEWEWPRGATPGRWVDEPGVHLFALTDYGQAQVLVPGATPPPVITDVSPATHTEGGPVTLTIRGSGFEPDVTVTGISNLWTGLEVTQMNRIDSGHLEVTVQPQAYGGRTPHGVHYDLVVANPSGAAARAPRALHVTPEFTMDLEFRRGKFLHVMDRDRRKFRIKVSGRFDPAHVDDLFAEVGKDIQIFFGHPDAEYPPQLGLQSENPYVRIRHGGRKVTWKDAKRGHCLKLRRNSKNRQFSLRFTSHVEVPTDGRVFVAIRVGDVTAYAEEVWVEREKKPGCYHRPK